MCSLSSLSLSSNFFQKFFPHRFVSNRPQPHRFRLCSLHTSPTLVRTATPQHPSTSRVHAPSNIRVVSCNPHELHFTDNQRNSLTAHNAVTRQSRQGNVHWSLLFKKWRHWARVQLCLCAFFSEGGFAWFCVRRIVTSGWSGRREALPPPPCGGAVPSSPLLGGAAWPHPSFWCFPPLPCWLSFFPPPFRGGAFLLSSYGWCCRCPFLFFLKINGIIVPK